MDKEKVFRLLAQGGDQPQTFSADNDLELARELAAHFSPLSKEKGLFIALEGIEGSGKSTQIKGIEEYFKARNYTVRTSREPGGTDFGEHLRTAITQSKAALHPLAELHLFASARAQHLFEFILPKLENPKTVVILDRYLDSSLAYQGEARGLGMSYVLAQHLTWPLCIVPHLTFYLDISLETSFKRQKARGNNKDYFERENQDFYQALRTGHEKALELFGERIKKIEGEFSPDEVKTKITQELDHFLKGREVNK